MNARRVVGVGAALAVVSAVVWRRVQRSEPLPTVAHVDLERYQGRWFEVARLPFRYEAKCVGDVTGRIRCGRMAGWAW